MKIKIIRQFYFEGKNYLPNEIVEVTHMNACPEHWELIPEPKPVAKPMNRAILNQKRKVRNKRI